MIETMLKETYKKIKVLLDIEKSNRNDIFDDSDLYSYLYTKVQISLHYVLSLKYVLSIGKST